MPRKARVILPSYPHHIVQRGHNRGVVFVENQDYEYYLDNLLEWKYELGLKVFSFCLMTNHIHLIVQASKDPSSIGQLMKHLAGRQTRFVNKQEKRTGSLWDGRYKVSPIENDQYLLQCCRYVELNPVKAGMVNGASDYRWSSYRILFDDVDDPLLDFSSGFIGLARTHAERLKRYEVFVNDLVAASREHSFLQSVVERNQLTGSARFVDEVEARIGLRIEHRAQGRPRSAQTDIRYV